MSRGADRERKVPVPGSTLRVDREKADRFRQRGRESSARSLARSRRRANPEAPGAISPASPQQRARVREIGFCLACGQPATDFIHLTFAHFWSRRRGGCDSRFCGGPLCVRPVPGTGCHDLYDDGKLDLMPIVVDRWELCRPIVQHSLQHALPVELLEAISNHRIQWERGRGSVR